MVWDNGLDLCLHRHLIAYSGGRAIKQYSLADGRFSLDSVSSCGAHTRSDSFTYLFGGAAATAKLMSLVFIPFCSHKPYNQNPLLSLLCC
jgi:hypothetical protein